MVNFTILAIVWTALLTPASPEQTTRVRLTEAIADSSRYNDSIVEVVEEFQAPAESPWYLCSLGCEHSRSMDDLVLFYVPDDFSAEAAVKRLQETGRTARYVRVRAVGRFQACDTACWGFPPRFRFRLVVSKIVSVKTSNKPFAMPKR
jgi:hypothetical protein